MLNPDGGEEDIDAFELRMRGRRVPDFEKVSQDCTLDFEYLGALEGARKARLDRQDEARWDVLQLPQQEPPERIRPRSVPAKKSDSSTARSEADEFFRPTPAPRPAGAARKGPAPPAKRWEVVGGSDKGGILVREGQSTTSKQLADRLSTGALVEELDLRGERLQFKRLTGTGPEIGWVSRELSSFIPCCVQLGNAGAFCGAATGRTLDVCLELVRPKHASPEEMLTLDCALSLQEELMEGFGKPEFQRTLAQLVRAHPTKAGAEFLRKRTELFLSVQSVVLPRYGFEGSPKARAPQRRSALGHEADEAPSLPLQGVVQMMAAYELALFVTSMGHAVVHKEAVGWLMIHRVAACRLKPSAMQEAQVANGSVVEPLPDAAFVLDDGEDVVLKKASELDIIDRLALAWVRFMGSMSDAKLAQAALVAAALILPLLVALIPLWLLLLLEKNVLMVESRGPPRHQSGAGSRDLTFSVAEEGVSPMLLMYTFVADFAVPNTRPFRSLPELVQEMPTALPQLPQASAAA
ncbi:unnamed protein product [Symbiodinium necroappetens]|uniref:Uncharacterized protein n=1 Tax=Symbiodinium necroappetens TaxID=1628268 RepID=A0A812JMF4_9DINO|nr:unnamed protein product [Symbiodinium necroappetens]